jgi:hypothetical protein
MNIFGLILHCFFAKILSSLDIRGNMSLIRKHIYCDDGLNWVSFMVLFLSQFQNTKKFSYVFNTLFKKKKKEIFLLKKEKVGVHMNMILI